MNYNIYDAKSIRPDLQHLNIADNFHKFFQSNEHYLSSIAQDIRKANKGTTKCVRLVLDMGDIRTYDKDICQALLEYPNDVISTIKDVLHNILKSEQYMLFLLLQNANIPIELGFKGYFGKFQMTPRGISSKFLGHLVRITGTVTKLSPKLVVPQDEQNHLIKENRNFISEYNHIDVRSAILQESPSNIPSGQLPRSLRVYLPFELGEIVRPGQQVQVSGVFSTSPFPILNSNHVAVLDRISIPAEIKLTNIKDFFDAFIKANNLSSCLFSRMSQCIAPSMMIKDIIREALLLQLFGGCRKQSKSGLTVRGDIHCLLIGSPGVGKSQLLRSMNQLAPQCIITSGRGSTAAGLTAAIKTDHFTKIKTLDAGAVVMADGGFVCIDEFDKMSEKDRVALHEAMEQQTVTIAKAGLHTTLNARCSVLAAANPLYGSYNENISIHNNVALPDSLLSRFDLLFLLFDRANVNHDRELANHVLSLRRGRQPGNVIDTSFLKKYIMFSRNEVYPVLTAETRSLIVSEYVELRSEAKTKLLPATPRLLETLIRLVTASARAHLRERTTQEDCQRVFKIMRYCLLGYDEEKLEHKNDLKENRKAFLREIVEAENSGDISITFQQVLEKINKHRKTLTIEDVQEIAEYFQQQGEFDVDGDTIYF